MMKPEYLKIFQELPEDKLLAICLLGEARGEPIEGRIAIGNVIKNRVFHRRWDGETYHEVILMPKQFSCFDDNNINYMLDVIEAPKGYGILWQEALWIAFGVLNDRLQDNTEGALNYHADYVLPSWAKEMIMTVKKGRHIFYKDK